MSKTKALKANLDQGSSPNEQTGEPVLTPLNLAHSRKQYMGYRNTELGYSTRSEPRMTDLPHDVVALQQGQYEHALLWRQRGSTPTARKIKAVITHQNLGSAYARPGPSAPDPLSRYMGAKEILPPCEYGSGYPHHAIHSQFPVMETELYNAFGVGNEK
jgi:hypothetical protein